MIYVDEINPEIPFTEFLIFKFEELIQNKYPELMDTVRETYYNFCDDYYIYSDKVPEELKPVLLEALQYVNNNYHFFENETVKFKYF